MNANLSKTLDDILAWMERKQEIRRRDYWERRLLRRIRLSLDGQYAKVIPMLGDSPRLENIPASFWEGAGIEFTRQIRPVLEEIFMQQAADMIQTLPIGVDWALVNTGAVEWARKYTFDLVKGINETTREALGKIIGEAFEKDLTRAELEQLIGELYSPIRSEMIAITEVTRASNEGTTEIRKELSEQGIEMIPVWNTRNDELVCDICGPLNNQKADHFTDDGEPVWIHPETGEEIEHTPHPRCRCSYGLELPEGKKAVKYSEDQPRDEGGRWTSDGGGQTAEFGGTIGGAAGQALGNEIRINKEQYQQMTDAGRTNLLAHELAHNIVEDKIIANNEEWKRASDALLLKTTERGDAVYHQFILGESRIGEAMVSTIAAYTQDTPNPMENFTPSFTQSAPTWNQAQWNGAMSWAAHALEYAGINKEEFNQTVFNLKNKLDAD